MGKGKLNPQKKADRSLCPVQVANVMQLKVHEVAAAFTELGSAALRWAGVDPFDHSTWVVHRGDCPG